jgi:putative sigma-54 modulation protein
MRLDITWRNCDPSETLAQRAEKKINHVARHLREPIHAHLVLTHQKDHFVADLVVSGGGEEPFTTRETSEGAYAVVDAVMEKMERGVKRHKEKALDRSRHPGADFHERRNSEF